MERDINAHIIQLDLLGRCSIILYMWLIRTPVIVQVGTLHTFLALSTTVGGQRSLRATYAWNADDQERFTQKIVLFVIL